jgi:RHS repeat-associated protein
VAADAVKAVNTSEASRIFFVHADHLNAPRVVTNSSNQIRWRWISDPFGQLPPEENPTNLGAFTLNLRLPGQVYDIESNLHYNYFRDYDPSTGRYVQSDPIGLRGGINTYAYVKSSPLTFIDPDGLLCIYSQGQGTLQCTNDTTGQQYVNCRGYAGNGPGLNNPAAQGIEDVGPLPQGEYTVGGTTSRRGPVTRPLTPNRGTNLLGRPGGFLIHGDNRDRNNSASQGCIIVPRSCREAIPSGETLRVVP